MSKNITYETSGGIIKTVKDVTFIEKTRGDTCAVFKAGNGKMYYVYCHSVRIGDIINDAIFVESCGQDGQTYQRNIGSNAKIEII